MADDIDLAQEITERHLEAAMAGRNQRPAGESLTHCEDCNKRIPEARRQAAPGCTRCVSCQEHFELLAYWRA